MPCSRTSRVFLLVLTVSWLVTILSAGVLQQRDYRGKKVTCVYSGLVGVARSCGVREYERAFTGTVRSAVEIGDTDKRLEIVPDEVFIGDSAQVTAITNQACLSTEIQAGDKWLFYLYRDRRQNVLVIPYDGRSKPVSMAEDDISTLRDLVRLHNSGLLTGTVDIAAKTPKGKPLPLANHKILARNVKNGTKHATYTNANGYFKFELPAGEYNIAPAPEYGLREVEALGSMLSGSVPVENGECSEHDFTVKQTAKHAAHR